MAQTKFNYNDNKLKKHFIYNLILTYRHRHKEDNMATQSEIDSADIQVVDMQMEENSVWL